MITIQQCFIFSYINTKLGAHHSFYEVFKLFSCDAEEYIGSLSHLRSITTKINYIFYTSVLFDSPPPSMTKCAYQYYFYKNIFWNFSS